MIGLFNIFNIMSFSFVVQESHEKCFSSENSKAYQSSAMDPSNTLGKNLSPAKLIKLSASSVTKV